MNMFCLSDIKNNLIIIYLIINPFENKTLKII